MQATKHDLDEMRQLLHRHQWTDLAEWVRALEELAELRDDQIEELARKPNIDPREARSIS